MKTGNSPESLTVLVLLGGTSAERDVSLASGQAIIDALRARNHRVLAVDTANGRRLLESANELLPQGIDTSPPKAQQSVVLSDEINAALSLPEAKDIGVVFIALHGGAGEDGHIQALLDLAQVPYSGSGATASALAMSKHLAKKIFVADGIPTPEWEYIGPDQQPPEFGWIVKRFGLPLAIKPDTQGSTVGLSIVKSAEEYLPAFSEAARFGSGVLMEEYIPGRELTVAVLGDKALPVVEIIPEHGIYDYECKYTSGKSRYVCPADLPGTLAENLRNCGYRAFRELGCEGYGRVDFRMNEAGEFFCLEVNTLPGMTSTSLVPKAARAAGISFEELVERICRMAIK